MKSNFIVEMKELPQRARALAPSELERVFGGCSYGGRCRISWECCSRECLWIDGWVYGLGYGWKVKATLRCANPR